MNELNRPYYSQDITLQFLLNILYSIRIVVLNVKLLQRKIAEKAMY
jgi:hypothetical protein